MAFKIFIATAQLAPIGFLLIQLSAWESRAAFTLASSSPSSQEACPQHFFGQGCSELGDAFRGALAEGQAICRQRYDSTQGLNDASLVQNFQNSLSSVTVRSAPTSANAACVNNAVGSLGSTQALAAGSNLLQIVAIDPALSSRIDEALSRDAALANQPGALELHCQTRLKAMSEELRQARTFLTSPLKKNKKVIPALVVTQAKIPAQLPAPDSSSSGADKTPAVSQALPTPASPALEVVRRAPPSAASAPASGSPISAAVPLTVPSSAIFPSPTPSDPIPAIPIFSDQAAGPPQCALDAMVAKLEREQESYDADNFIEKFFVRHFGNAPPQDAQAIIHDPSEAVAAYDNLTPSQQAEYLKLCPTQTSPADALVRVTDSSTAGAMKGAPAATRGATSLTELARMSSEMGWAAPSLATTEPWPPECVRNVMVNEVKEAQAAFDKKGFFAKIIARLKGETPPKNSNEILADPGKAFELLSANERASLFGICQHAIPPDQWALAEEETKGQFVVPDFVKAEAERPVLVASSSGGVGWPPACALDAMTDHLHALQAQDQAQGWLLTRLLSLDGQPVAPGTRQLAAIYKDPRAAFLSLAPDAQTQYMKACLLEGFDDLTVSSSSSSRLMAAVTDERPSRPPQCALDAYKKEMSADLADYKKRNLVSRVFVTLFGTTPPPEAAEVANGSPADVTTAFSYLSSDDQVKYLRACLPCPVEKPDPGFLKRTNNWFQNLGWFGKILTGLGIAFLGGFMNRFRGGGLFATGSTQEARGIYAGVTGLVGLLLGGWAGALAGVLQILPLMAFGWARYFYYSDQAGKIGLNRLAGMAYRGFLQTVGSGVVLASAGFSPWFIPAGLMMGPIYSFANLLFPSVRVLPHLGSGFISGGTDAPEFINGFWTYGVLAAVLLAGNGYHAPIVSCILQH